MIIVNVDRSTIPPGATWPGLAVYYGGGLDHIVGDDITPTSANNLVNLARVLPRIEITYQQYLTFKNTPPPPDPVPVPPPAPGPATT